jgi:hypothetical protein
LGAAATRPEVDRRVADNSGRSIVTDIVTASDFGGLSAVPGRRLLAGPCLERAAEYRRRKARANEHQALNWGNFDRENAKYQGE